MIYTVTFNPAIDYVLNIDSLNVGEIIRSKSEMILAGGKGINVSTVLTNLEVDNIALGFVSGFTGDEIEKIINQSKIKSDFVKLEDGYSRINVKIEADVETAINANGPKISCQKLNEFMNKIDEIKEGDFLVLSGSVPKSLDENIYEEICQKVAGKNVNVVVDATKNLLLQVLKYKPFFIKPNNHELGELFGVEINNPEDAIKYGKILQEKGARNVLISMGRYGAVLIAENGEVYIRKSPEGKRVNTVGAGDSMVAGFLAGYLKFGDYEKALNLGVSAGTASALSQYLGTKEEIYNLFNNMK